MHLNELYDTTEGKRSDKWSIYLDIYSEVFKGFKNKDVNLLEIGIQNGGSLEIWSRFFNNGKRFIGCDINEKCSSLSYDDKRISVIIGDANAISVKENIQKLFDGQINILIDDGSHTSGDIIKAFLITSLLLAMMVYMLLRTCTAAIGKSLMSGLYKVLTHQ